LQHLGACEIEQGRLVEGTEALRRVLREPLPAQPSAALHRAYERAQAMLDRTRPNIALLTIVVEELDQGSGSALPADGAAVVLDGQAVPPALLETERPTDPGEHVIEASAPGRTTAHASVTLAPGEQQRVVLTLERAAETGAVADAAMPGGAAADAAEDADAMELSPVAAARAARERGAVPSHTAAYIAWTAGAVALALGTGFGVAALVRSDQLNAQCEGNRCSPEVSGRIETAKQYGTISTIGFGAGLAAGVVGAVLYMNAASADAREPRPGAARAQVGPGGAELRVAF
jgi:hypothetical protein